MDLDLLNSHRSSLNISDYPKLAYNIFNVNLFLDVANKLFD